MSQILLSQIQGSLEAVALLGMVLGVSGATYAAVTSIRGISKDAVDEAFRDTRKYISHIDEYGSLEIKSDNCKHETRCRKARLWWHACGVVPAILMTLISFVIVAHYLVLAAIYDTPTMKIWPWYWIAVTVMMFIDLASILYSHKASNQVQYSRDCMLDLYKNVKIPRSSAGSESKAGGYSPPSPALATPAKASGPK